MPKLSLRKNKTKEVIDRYPASLAPLFALDYETGDTDYTALAVELVDYVTEVIDVALDMDFLELPESEPAGWAPIHALQVLRELAPIEAAEPLTGLFNEEGDWIGEDLPAVYSAIGPQAIPVLRDYLFTASHNPRARIIASNCLVAIGQAHRDVRNQIVQMLVDFLDRPEADESADEEEITTFVIADLGELGDRTAYEAIRRAFDEDRVAPAIVSLEDIEREFRMRSPLKPEDAIKLRREPGVHLTLQCTACGREREHIFDNVYYDARLASDRKKSEKYSPLIIPEIVVCPKCGAVDQYELGPNGQMKITADLLARTFAGPDVAPDDRIRFMEFSDRWGSTHPLEALERYEREIARRPNDPELYVGYGNVLKFLGKQNEARDQFQQAIELDSGDIDAWTGLAQIAGVQGNLTEAIDAWREVQSLATAKDDRPLAAEASEFIAELQRGVVPPFAPALSTHRQFAANESSAQPDRFAPRNLMPEKRDQPKIGRNDPCPCGSGRKYKHCHGRPGS